MNKLSPADRAVLMAAFARMDVVALAIALACLGAVTLFLLTAVLLLRGAEPGHPIGPHLGTLAVYFPGYDVTWRGSVVGAIYGAVVGAVVGYAWALLWNLSHVLYIAAVVVRGMWWRLLAD